MREQRLHNFQSGFEFIFRFIFNATMWCQDSRERQNYRQLNVYEWIYSNVVQLVCVCVLRVCKIQWVFFFMRSLGRRFCAIRKHFITPVLQRQENCNCSFFCCFGTAAVYALLTDISVELLQLLNPLCVYGNEVRIKLAGFPSFLANRRHGRFGPDETVFKTWNLPKNLKQWKICFDQVSYAKNRKLN